MNNITTNYRYITRTPGICGGRPIINNTRTSVQTIIEYYKRGMTVEEILEGLPHLTAAQVYEALSYYHDHQTEIERDIQENQLHQVMQRYGLKIASDGRLVSEHLSS